MSLQINLRLITYSPEIVDGQPIYVSSNCHPIKALKKYEPAGHSFHAVALKLLGCEEEKVEPEDEKIPNEKDQSYMASSDSYSSKGKKKSADGTVQQDHYALLGLGNLRYLATEDQIKKSYRETALKYHPDKQAALLLAEETEAAKQTKKDEIENHFKSIQEAYEVLIDTVKRRIYDSTDEFDDEIPTDCAPQDFYKVFGPAFLRNGRWSVTQPIPFLGDENTPIQDVDTFYNFWYNFKSWREFPHADEFDIEQAESRDHKRWMERQNAKLSEKARKEEYVRVRNLVDNAFKRDPRIIKRKEEEKAEKQKKRKAKYVAKQLLEEEAARVAEEEKRRKEEEDKKAAEIASQQKKIREKEKKLLRKERTRLRTLSAPVISERMLNISDDDVESLCMSLDILTLKDLCDKMERNEGLARAKFLKNQQEGNNDEPESVDTKSRDDKKPQQNGAVQMNGTVSLSSFEKKEKPWGKEEIELLKKGVLKYPKGTAQRWEVISDFIGTNRSVEEILKATKTVLLQKPDSNKAFDSFLEKRKPSPSIASPLSTRDEIGTVTDPKSSENSAPAKSDSGESSSNKSSNSQTPDNVVPAEAVPSSDQDVWSAIQERALIQALKTFPKDANQRWERVATAVPGKTMNQCKKKFALLKESFRNKKTSS
ncbi:hypothetical protein ACFE04_009579 [Oxalis oulophora]